MTQINEPSSMRLVYKTPTATRIGFALICILLFLLSIYPFVIVSLAAICGTALSSFGLSKPLAAILVLAGSVLLRLVWRDFARNMTINLRLAEDSVETVSALERC